MPGIGSPAMPIVMARKRAPRAPQAAWTPSRQKDSGSNLAELRNGPHFPANHPDSNI
jgi:hypothetical protein